MASEIVRLGRAAWERLKKGRASWSDWVLVGLALQEGRAIAMRNAGTTSPIGGGYACAFNDWLLYNRFDMDQSDRAKLLTVMGILPEIEQWRATLTPTQRMRVNHPSAILNNYRKAIGVRPAPGHIIPPPPPAPPAA